MNLLNREFQYRGERNYVHGTDMYLDLFQAMEEAGIGPIDGKVGMKILHKATNQLDLLICPPGESGDRPENVSVETTFGIGEDFAVAWYVESDRPVTDSKPYDEAEIRSKCTIEDEAIRLTTDTGFEAIEVISSMATHLNTVLVPPGEKKWLFTRLHIDRPLVKSDGTDVEVKITKNMNNVMTRSSIVVSGEALGDIFFSLAEV